MTPLQYSGQQAVIIGYGITGRAAAEFLIRNGATVRVYDDKASMEGLPESAAAISPVDESFQRKVVNADLVLVSPGVPRSHPVFKFAKEPISELELAYRHTTVPIVAVTGTNGKTTVTTLVTRMLENAGIRARAVGNIGTSVVSMLEEDLDYLVVEASSFQLATISSFRPRVAVWTNFSPDHLDWHQGIDHYLASKARILENQAAGDTAVLNAGDPTVSTIATPSGVRRIGFGLGNYDFGFSPELAALTANGEPFSQLSDMARTLPHDLENALASSAAAFSVGVDLATISGVLREFTGLPHRVEYVGSIGGVKYFNDSKATTPASVVAAASGFESVILIAGGKNKGLDLSPLAGVAPKLKALVAMGDAADDLLAVFSGITGLRIVKALSMAEAVDVAREMASEGDVVLLSPGCTSFDRYRSYEERGEDFRNAFESAKSAGGGK